ncbi:hypothetical protein P171DRAFT_513850 [Karstenula rhodostoma CBS 690.94]|uniref:Uncharacterized protein n=1 Tax=Karstenula rhodostoma CBS 690.94 TaxID=1392251 RepID=A0A9P4PIR6_9PLEO|nr:hypothetical protein P171DRAFT_513850 [Karstenula rhodostoma CBS 690.94]
MAVPKDLGVEDIMDAVNLDATKADDVELFRYRFSIATSDAAKKMLSCAASTKMLITAILCDTAGPHRMIALADLVLNASSEATCHRVAFTNLFLTNMEYERTASVGDLDDVDKVRVELGYALAACLPLLSREALEKIMISFSEWVKENRMKEVRSIIEVVRSQGTAGPDFTSAAPGTNTPKFAPNKDRSTMTAEKRSRYIQEMDSDGLTELLSRLTLSNYHTEAVRKAALAQLSKKAWESKA